MKTFIVITSLFLLGCSSELDAYAENEDSVKEFYYNDVSKNSHDSAKLVVIKIIKEIEKLDNCIKEDSTLRDVLSLYQRIEQHELNEKELKRLIIKYRDYESIVKQLKLKNKELQGKNDFLNQANTHLKGSNKKYKIRLKKAFDIGSKLRFKSYDIKILKNGKETKKASKVDYITATFKIEANELSSHKNIKVTLFVENLISTSKKQETITFDYNGEEIESIIEYKVTGKLKKGTRKIGLMIQGNTVVYKEIRLR